MLIDLCCKNDKLECSIVSETFPHLRKGAIKDFSKIMSDIGFWSDSQWNKGESKYTFSNGSYIEFFSADQPGKVRGPRRDVLFINECNNISFEVYHQLAIRTNKIIYLDYNPVAEFWVHKELLQDKDTDFVKLTFQDNEALSDVLRKEILKAKDKAYYNSELEPPKLFEEANIKNNYWHNWWKVYGLGETGSLEGVIFENWKQIDKIPEEARLLGYGLDFGFSSDPAAVVAVYKYNDQRIVDEICYSIQMSNERLSEILPKQVIVYADSAEPKSIREIQLKGIQIIGVDKGPDSIRFGINTMQQQEYLITKRSTNLINELRTYRWDRNKDGEVLPRPIGADHLIDALRYHEMMSLGSHSSFGKYDVR